VQSRKRRFFEIPEAITAPILTIEKIGQSGGGEQSCLSIWSAPTH
jgi:hypothetical protein